MAVACLLVACGGGTDVQTSSAVPPAGFSINAPGEYPQPHVDALTAPATRSWHDNLAVDTALATAPAQVYRLYRAAFGRVPDLEGLGYNVTLIENAGLSLQQLAATFISSAEFASKYGSLGNSDFVSQLYANVLKRTPDAGGLAYHVGNIQAGRIDRAGVLVEFSESAENQAATNGALQAGVNYVPYDTQATNAASACSASDADALGSVAFATVNPVAEKAWGCRVVTAPSYPVLDGAKATRVEVRADDCTASNTTNDCTAGNSRHQIVTQTAMPGDGRTVSFQSSVFIPSQARFRPKGSNSLFLHEVTATSGASVISIAALEVNATGDLVIRTPVGFTTTVAAQYAAAKAPQNRWIKVRYELLATSQSNGYLRVYVNDQLVANETRATLPAASAVLNLRIGIVNLNKALAQEAYTTQIAYFDGVVSTFTPAVVVTTPTVPAPTTPTGTGTSSGGSTSTGRCVFPDDRAADGSRCGARASTVRPGGN